MTNLHVFEFSGTGNFSLEHNWDNGLSAVIHNNPISFSDAIEKYGETINLPETPEEGVFDFCHTFADTRNVFGVIIAPTKAAAMTMLQTYKDSYPIEEYHEQ